jgi:FMN-dependent NADH-azoreductase
MPTLLHIDSSPRGTYSVSRAASQAFVDAWKQKNAGGEVITRDLAQTKLTFVDLDWIAGAYSAPEQHTPEHKKALALSDELIAELQRADEVVIGAPMYNFSVPANVKAWIDHIVRYGVTFAQENGQYKGLLTGKKATAILASGGNYAAGSGAEAYDQESPYLKSVLGFVGITDVTVIKAGGTNAVTQGQVQLDEFLKPVLGEVQAAV